VPPDPALFGKVGALIDEMRAAGVLQATEGLSSTKDGARIHFEGKKRKVIDGPFAESKELVAGFAILNLPSKADAIEWAARFGEIVKVHEVEIRPIPAW
ncbi:MAG TPA: YciI family protein, partial [Polyangiaceae bacterium]|nr:YciI family protein [Polyangiaceae bacterium]